MARLRAQAGADVWRVLESLDVDEQTRGWFERARREGSRFVLPEDVCEDMAGQLRAAGFTRVQEAPWHSALEVKDIRISVYPFHGEQPWVGFADPAGRAPQLGQHVHRRDARQEGVAARR